MIAAATQAGSDDPAKVRDALQSLKMQAISGSVTFDSSGNPIKSAAILRYTRTGQEYVATVAP
jgi:ABC-type branched-subunit amino acid transport system substrate-binding protein